MQTLPASHNSHSCQEHRAKDKEARITMTTSVSGLSASKQKETIVSVENPDKRCYFSRTQVAAFTFAFFLTMCVVIILVTCFGNSSRFYKNYDRKLQMDPACDCTEPFLLQVRNHTVTDTVDHDVIGDVTTSRGTKSDTATLNSEQSELGIRLPGDIVPEHYDLDLHLRIEGEYSKYTGSVKIFVNITRETSLVVFHVKPYKILEVFEEEVYIYRPSHYSSDKDLDKIRVPIITYSRDAHKEIHAARLKETLKAGYQYVIFIRKFRGYIIGDLKGLYMSSYKDKHGEKR